MLEILGTNYSNTAHIKNTRELIFIATEITELYFRASFACIGDLTISELGLIFSQRSL